MKNLIKTSFHFKWMLSLCFFLNVAHVSIAQTSKSFKAHSGYGEASYSTSTAGTYMTKWLVAGPIVLPADTDEAGQQKAFNDDPVLSVEVVPKKGPVALTSGSTKLEWKLRKADDNKLDFDKIFPGKDLVAAYAMAEIVSDNEKKAVLAFGSDDALRVILNGKVVHNNWMPRGLQPDQDIVPVTLVKGSNQLIVRVQDVKGAWEFTGRILDESALTDRLVTSAYKGNVDDVNMLLAAGASINGKSGGFLTPMNAARLAGREDVIKLLSSNGAMQSAMPTTEQLIDKEYSALNGKKASGIAVLVAKDGKIVYEKGFGYANIEKNELITPETKFRIGSITKQFIASSILKLQEEGKVTVHDKLSKFIPDFNKGDEVTIHHLLTHTSGIHSYTNKPDFVARVTTPITEDQLVELIKKEPYDFEPGERYQYNNSGYVLLGYIIRKITGKSFGDYLRETFFVPLGMNNTGVHEKSLKLTNEALGYSKQDGQYKADINWDMSWAGGAGALYSTVRDLYLWNEAVFNGKVISKESLNAAFTPVVLNSGKTPAEGKYGYGWALGELRELEVIEHGGGLHGFISRLTRFPQHNLTVVMLTNVMPTEVTIDPLVIAEFNLWESLKPQKSYAVAATNEDVKQYEGRYDFGNGMVLTVTSKDGNLLAQVSGQQAFPIFPSAPGEYFWKVVEARIRFIKNEAGEVTHGAFSQNGNNVMLVKLKDDVIVAVDPALLDFYVGRYDLGDNVVTISKENDKLFAQTKTSPKFEIKPLSETEFTIQELNARLTFFREGAKPASKFTLDMAGQKKDAPRME